MRAKERKPKPHRVSVAKADRFAAEAHERGWDTTTKVSKTGRTVRVIADRGAEDITIDWREGAFVPGTCEYRFGEAVCKRLVNARSALRKMEDQPDLKKITKEDRMAVIIASVPFDPAADRDDEILAELYGRVVVWRNNLSGATEQAQVLPLERRNDRGERVRGSRQTRMSTTRTGRRIVTFCDGGGEGFRSVALDSILQVKGA